MTSDNIQGLESLEAWKKAMALAVAINREVLPLLPASERWNLDTQIRRAVSSVPANIAEGHGRHYYQDNVHFCYIARGSLTEVHSHLTLAFQLGYLPSAKYEELRHRLDELIRIINGYIGYLKRAKIGANEPGAGLAVREDGTSYSWSESDGDSFPGAS